MFDTSEHHSVVPFKMRLHQTRLLVAVAPCSLLGPRQSALCPSPCEQKVPTHSGNIMPPAPPWLSGGDLMGLLDYLRV